VTTIETLVLDARWEAIELLLPHRHPATASRPVSTIAPPWPASSTRLHHMLLDELGRQGQLDGSRASLNSLSTRARRGRANGPTPTRRPGGGRLAVTVAHLPD
jgi:hypothetical protein